MVLRPILIIRSASFGKTFQSFLLVEKVLFCPGSYHSGFSLFSEQRGFLLCFSASPEVSFWDWVTFVSYEIKCKYTWNLHCEQSLKSKFSFSPHLGLSQHLQFPIKKATFFPFYGQWAIPLGYWKLENRTETREQQGNYSSGYHLFPYQRHIIFPHHTPSFACFHHAVWSLKKPWSKYVIFRKLKKTSSMPFHYALPLQNNKAW